MPNLYIDWELNDLIQDHMDKMDKPNEEITEREAIVDMLSEGKEKEYKRRKGID